MKISNKISINTLLFMVLFTPTLNPYTYIILVAGTVVSLSLSNTITFNFKSNAYKIVLLLLIFTTLTSILRFLVHFNSSIRDISELGRIILIMLLTGTYQNFTRNGIHSIQKILFLYAVVNIIIVYSQKMGGNVLSSVIENYYTSEVQRPHTKVRATGLGTGPGDQGIMFTLLFTFFFSCFVCGTLKLINGISSIICCYITWATQSQTSFIGLVLSAILILIVNIKMGRYSQKFTSIYIALITLFIFFSTSFVEKFIYDTSYLSTLFNQGLERSSYEKRVEKWENVMNLSNDRLSGYFLGWGKEYFGSKSGALDNEYVYIYLIYGPLVFFVFLFFLFTQIKIILKLYNKNYDEVWLMSTALLPTIMLMAWPSSVYMNLKTGFVAFLFFYYLLSKYTNHRKQ